MADRVGILRTYRQLLKTSNTLFGSHLVAKNAAKLKIRDSFKSHTQEKDQTKVQSLLKEAKDLTDFLKKNIVQGVYNESRKSFDLKIKPETEKWKHNLK